MVNRLNIKIERCIGCRSCELACSMENEGVFNPSKSRINVISFTERLYPLPYNIPFTCKQCIDALCLKACPVGAIFQEKGKIKTIKINEKDCIGCGKCVSACPFGVMFFDRVKKKAFKCELCNGNPACVRICPVEAISFKRQKEFMSKETVLLIKGYSILCNLRKKEKRTNGGI